MASLIIALLMEGIEALASGAAGAAIDAGAEAAGGALLESGATDVAETLTGKAARGIAKTAAGIGIGTGLGFLGDKIAGAIAGNGHIDANSASMEKRRLINSINKMKLSQQNSFISNFLHRLGDKTKGINIASTSPLLPLQVSNSIFTGGPVPHIPPNPVLYWPKKISKVRDVDIIVNRNPNPSFGQTVWRQYIK